MVILYPNFFWTTNLIPLIVPGLQVNLTLLPIPEAGGVAQDLAKESLARPQPLPMMDWPSESFPVTL